ncbi:ubiquinol-cytochrome C chaperone family protein [Sphingosinicella sp. CPCC 101087]|uniref:ubiquinol-cytochrome C chaperone family protein n=1 Tax=Sphingosinicella sp. CPCC 101087 TaxID=2497754 RepID=UPI00101D1E54|nr:ubiquinol-cytochrome C chaperone family protein [Sphingosinicella sp. CPCC 101087]
MSFLQRIFGRTDPRRAYDPLYRAIVAAAREPGWYREGGVPDTVGGRFDMVAAITALVLLRLESEGDAGREPSVLLTELFVDDMDSSLRQIGIGDYVVGKHVGRMMGALGGRLTALRAARAGEAGFAAAARRNIYHDSPPSEEALAWVAGRLERLSRAIDAQPLDTLLAGEVAA